MEDMLSIKLKDLKGNEINWYHKIHKQLSNPKTKHLKHKYYQKFRAIQNRLKNK